MRHQFESTACTVTLNGVPATCAVGVPVLPVVVPGFDVSPGRRTCSLFTVPRLVVTMALVDAVLVLGLIVWLLRRRGEVLSRTAIAEQVWGINFDSDTNIVDVAIRRLRKKVDDPFSCKLIQTIRGVGYVLEEPK